LRFRCCTSRRVALPTETAFQRIDPDVRQSAKHSWYKNAEGKSYILGPWRLVDDWGWTRESDFDDFVVG